MSEKIVRFIHISDTHLGEDKVTQVLGLNTYQYFEKLVKSLKKLPFKSDFILHTGDIAAVKAEDKGYQNAQLLLTSLEIPIYYVTGNHDSSAKINKYLKMGPKKQISDDPDQNAYYFDKQGIRFITLDGRGPDKIDPHGILPDYQLKLLKREINKDGNPLVIFIHFPPLSLDSTWHDRDMLLLNGEKLHQILMEKPEKVRGVFYGHVHKNMTVFKDGILYSSAGSSFGQLLAYPNQEKPIIPANPGGEYNIVTITKDKTIIKQQAI